MSSFILFTPLVAKYRTPDVSVIVQLDNVTDATVFQALPLYTRVTFDVVLKYQSPAVTASPFKSTDGSDA